MAKLGLRASIGLSLITVACDRPREPDNTAEAVPPFELICRYDEVGVENRVSYRIDGQSIRTKGQYDDSWKDICEAEHEDTPVLQCDKYVRESVIEIHKKVSFREVPRDEFISIDRVSGRFELVYNWPNDPSRTNKGQCVKSEDRAF